MNLRVSYGPHLLTRESTSTLMRDVIIALIPAAAAGIYLFGTPAALVLAVSILSCVLFEYLWQRMTKQDIMLHDLSAVVTGLILGLNLPAGAPLWLPVVGGAFAILLVKQFFGGIGHNFMNPAMAARAALLASWPAIMGQYTLPFRQFVASAAPLSTVDAITSATPLASAKSWSQLDMFLGQIPGTIGEVSKAAILLGFAYLLIRRTIRWHIPVVFVATACLTSWLLGADPLQTVLTGGLLFGAVFMATDYVSNPMYVVGQCIFAVGAGLLVAVIRKFGSYPEGVTYAILVMNCLTPLIDRVTKRRVYGMVKKHA